MSGSGRLRAVGHAANPLTEDAALHRGAAIFLRPVPHGSVLRDGPCFFSAIGAMRRQPGFVRSHRPGLLDGQAAIEGVRNA
jgi:hypothetical protein